MHKVKVLKTEYVTHNVKHFVVERPANYDFISGQATDVSINKPALENELRPFTFTCVNSAPNLEFMIKIYTDHDGVTNKLGKIEPGDELIVHDVFGAINYKEPGLFIAGGAGITPFVSILRQLKMDGKLEDNTLLFANHTEGDIILKDELSNMLGPNFINIISHPELPGTKAQTIDRELLEKYVHGQSNYYICGPDAFVDAMVKYLKELGVQQSQIVIEE
ncbi:MAG TPA: FAD-binding oxidoreductase [Mucilaginibacter sp.]|nr:FAD-binding oxidoreductase [Mucilaginibacter sp.]